RFFHLEALVQTGVQTEHTRRTYTNLHGDECAAEGMATDLSIAKKKSVGLPGDDSSSRRYSHHLSPRLLRPRFLSLRWTRVGCLVLHHAPTRHLLQSP